MYIRCVLRKQIMTQSQSYVKYGILFQVYVVKLVINTLINQKENLIS